MKKNERIRSYPSAPAIDAAELSRLRAAVNLKQTELAERLRMDERTIRSAEKGEWIREDYATAIAGFYGKRVEELFAVSEKQLRERLGLSEALPFEAPNLLWHVPYARDALFKGREVELESLHEPSKSKNVRRIIQALTALPGLGKTSIAIEYAYRFRKDYALVWWLDASSNSSLLKEYEALAARLNARAGTHPQKDVDVIHHVSDELSGLSDWLFIFDGASSADNVRPYLPTTGTGHIIITAADRNWQGTAAICDVGPLAPSAAIGFLDDRLAGMPVSFGKDLVSELAAELSYIPAATDAVEGRVRIPSSLYAPPTPRVVG
jgi:transcriptional regulator with XRE-family HTH domain